MGTHSVVSEAEGEFASVCAQIDATLKNAHGEKVNICYAILKIIESASQPQRGLILRYFLEDFDTVQSNEELNIEDIVQDIIDKHELDQLKKKYGTIVDALFEMILKENPPEDDFYTALWNVLTNSIFGDEKARAFGLYWVLIDRRTPYFHLERGLRMADDQFKAAVRRVFQKAAKIRFILDSEFQQRSEEADLVLNVLDSVENREDRAALLAIMLLNFRTTEERLKAQSQTARDS